MKVQLFIFLFLTGTLAFGQNKNQLNESESPKSNLYFNKNTNELFLSFDIDKITVQKLNSFPIICLKTLFSHKKWIIKTNEFRNENELNFLKETRVSKQFILFGKYDVSLNIYKTKSLKITEVE